MKRLFTVRLNIDDFCAALDLVGEDGYCSWLAGFRAGLRGARCSAQAGTDFAMGHAMGTELLAEAGAFRSAKSDAGKASAEKRLEKYGSAIPNNATNKEPNTKPNTPPNEQSNCKPNHLVSNIQYPVSSIEQLASSAPPGQGIFDQDTTTPPKPEDDPDGIYIHVRWRTSDPERTRENRGELIGLLRRYGRQEVIQAAERITHRTGAKCWPNEILEEIVAAQKPAAPAKPKAPIQDVDRLPPDHPWMKRMRGEPIT